MESPTGKTLYFCLQQNEEVNGSQKRSPGIPINTIINFVRMGPIFWHILTDRSEGMRLFRRSRNRWADDPGYKINYIAIQFAEKLVHGCSHVYKAANLNTLCIKQDEKIICIFQGITKEVPFHSSMMSVVYVRVHAMYCKSIKQQLDDKALVGGQTTLSMVNLREY